MTHPQPPADPGRAPARAPAAGGRFPGPAAAPAAGAPPTPEERGVAVVEALLREFGADAALSVRVAAGGAALELAGAAGAARDWGDLLGDACVDRAPRLPLDRDHPLADAVRTGAPVFCASREVLAARYPAVAVAAARHGVHALAAVPARHLGRVHGAVALLFDRPRRLTAEDRATLRALAGRYARALAHARLYYSEHAARAEAEAARAAEAEARREAERARESAERANRAKDDFLAVVSHELRTPLQAVIGFSELLDAGLAGPLTGAQREFVERIQAGGAQLLHLIEELLGFARTQAGQETVHVETFDAAATVAQVVAMAAPLAERKRLALRVDAPTHGVRFASDPFKVRQIVTNLVGNAVKFTARGEVAVQVEGWDRDGRPPAPGAAAARLRVTVRDTGPGIPAEHREAVFAPFVQVAAPDTRTAGGTGLGLSVVRQLARLLGGEVRLVASEPGRGSVFEAELPCVARAPEPGGARLGS